MNTPRVQVFAGAIGVIAIVGAQDGLGIPTGIRIGLIVLALIGVAALIAHSRRVGDPRVVPPESYAQAPPPPPTPSPPPPASAVARISPAEKGRSALSRTLLGISCPECGYRFSKRNLPKHMEEVHRLRLLDDWD
jgi:hypothetical protein